MHAERRYFPIALAAMICTLTAGAALWPGCALLFQPLAANAGSDATINVGQSLVLSGAASGGSGQYSYSWQPTAGLSDASAAQPTFTPLTIGTRVFTLTVTDSLGNTATDTVSVSVGTTRPPLTAQAGPDMTASIGLPVVLQGSATGGNGQYMYSWAAPTGISLAGANSATPTFTPAALGTFVFTLTVTDTEGQSSTDTVSVAVTGNAALGSLMWGADVSTGGYQVVAVFNQALAKSSAETVANYRVTGTSTTPTSASLGTDSRTVVLRFGVALASTAQFDLSVGGGITDAGGNSIPQISARTPERNPADTTPPSVASNTWGSLVSGGYQINVTFSEVLDKPSAQTASAYRINGATTTAQSATLGTDGKTVTVVFTGVTLTSTSKIDVGVGDSIKDINANSMSVQLNLSVSGTFPTSTTVSSIVWGAGFTAGGYQILVTFSGTMDETSAETVANWRISGTSTAPTSATLSADKKTVTLVFAIALARTSELDISVGGALKDSSGNAISQKSNQAITAASGDTTAPTISSVKWAANFSSGGYQILVTFNEAMDRTTVQTTTGWRINGTATTPSAVVLGTDGKTATLTFLAALAIADKLDVSVGGGILDINGNALAQQLGQAIVAATDVTLPTLASVNWAAHFGGGGYQVLVVFSEAMDRASAQTLANYQINPGAVLPTTATLQTDGKTVALVFAGLRHSTDLLDVSIGSTVKDINNNAAAQALNQAIAANTTDTTGPNIASRLWKTGQTTYQALITFSDAMDEATAETAGSYSMTVNGGAAINPATATLAADGLTVTLDFLNAGVFKTNDQLTVAAAVKNVNGRANTSTTAAAMTATGGARAAATSYVWVAPPLSYGVTLTFPDVLDIASATTAANYTLGASATPPTAAPTISANGRVVTLAWAIGAFAKTDQLTITANVHDIAGRSLAEAVTVTQNADVTGPAITSRMWGANQTSYRAIVAFDHAMDKTSTETFTNYNLGGATGTAAVLSADGTHTVTVTFGTGALNAADTLTAAAGVLNINSRANTSVAAAPLAVNPADVAAPVPVTAVRLDAIHVDVTFNEVVDKASAEAAVYTITGGAVTAAVLQPGGIKVRLTTNVDPSGKSVTTPAGVADVNNRPMAAPVPLAVSG